MKAKNIPKTIEKLSRFCASRAVPLNRMRFFIGEDCREPKAFGIYQDVYGDFVVYKNKADGTTVTRYRGPDEEHAVKEIFAKLESEIQRNCASPKSEYKRSKNTTLIVILSIIVILALVFLVQDFSEGGVAGGLAALAGALLNGWIYYTPSDKRNKNSGYAKAHSVRWVQIEWLHWDMENTNWSSNW